MKLKNLIERSVVYCSEGDGEDLIDYRRNSAQSWEQRYGESWEPVHGDKEVELEKAYWRARKMK
jgi:hypothetical protein